MESKYKERAEQILNTCVQCMDNTCITNEAAIDAMCQLAEEVEKVYKDPLIFGDGSTIQRVYSKAYVEELLAKQRELCAEEADTETAYKPCYEHGMTIVNKESILNAKLKIDEHKF